jgi:hypothetical protein
MPLAPTTLRHLFVLGDLHLRWYLPTRLKSVSKDWDIGVSAEDGLGVLGSDAGSEK